MYFDRRGVVSFMWYKPHQNTGIFNGSVQGNLQHKSDGNGQPVRRKD